MKFLMLVCWDAEKMDAQTEPSPTDAREEDSFPWLDDLQTRGIWVTGDQLAPPRRARSVRVRGGKAMVTDGPFAETKEAVGGFDILECESLEEAVAIAAAHPVAQTGTVEVRPLWGTDSATSRATPTCSSTKGGGVIAVWVCNDQLAGDWGLNLMRIGPSGHFCICATALVGCWIPTWISQRPGANGCGGAGCRRLARFGV